MDFEYNERLLTVEQLAKNSFLNIREGFFAFTHDCVAYVPISVLLKVSSILLSIDYGTKARNYYLDFIKYYEKS